MRSRPLLAAALVLILCTRAAAQRDGSAIEAEAPAARDENPIAIKLGGVLGLPVGGGSERFDPGGGFAVGLTLLPRSIVSVQAEYLYSFHDLEGDVLDIDGLDGNHTLQYGNLNVSLRAVRSGGFELYILGGPGIYRRAVEVTRIAAFGSGRFCDPLLFVCSPVTIPMADVLGTETSIDFGVNAGLGISFVLSPPLRLFVEARYHYIWGPSLTGPGGRRFDSDAEYAPVILGLTF